MATKVVHDGDWTPRPDPTSLTTEQLRRELSALNDVLSERMTGLERLRDEKFAGVQKQFAERDTRVEQTARDTKVAVDAALQAAEKAVGKQTESFTLSINKSEAATTKQIDQQAASQQVTTAALAGQISDVKERTARIESQAIGWASSEARQSSLKTVTTSSTGLYVAIAVALLATLAFFVQHVGVH